jgi:hypothetical protein
MLINVLCAGLAHEDESITSKKLAKILDDSDFEDLIGTISKAITGALPDKKDVKNK